jgi:anti-sigma B factor antagonist
VNSMNTSIQNGYISAEVTRKDSQAIVTVAGRVTVDSSPHLRSVLLRLLRDKTGEVVVIDVSKVSYLDTSGIATLLEASKAARKRSVKLRLERASGRVRMLAELVELPKILDALGSEVIFG